MPNNHLPPDENSGFTERHRTSDESPRTEAERSRQLAEEAREVRDGHLVRRSRWVGRSANVCGKPRRRRE